jgi:hypothetical protein
MFASKMPYQDDYHLTNWYGAIIDNVRALVWALILIAMFLSTAVRSFSLRRHRPDFVCYFGGR